ncbi:TetR family transcriptional regulator [Streptomyces sp. NPDC001027]|uniref:TetR family transcriptional regulator n=1 Tax=Streptomyces sp. NPDC001027 TaxID=3154771 RepID=UPI003329F885
MAWDTEGTKRKILNAAATEFAASGPDGTTIERIAKLAGVNKERVYNYFGSKQGLFSHVLADQLATAAIEIPANPTANDIGEFAGRLYDYRRKHPELARLLLWEGLTFGAEVPGEQSRGDYYGRSTSALSDSQAAGQVDPALPADLLHFLVLSVAGYWAVLPQVARMITGADTDDAAEDKRRRAGVVEAARRLVLLAQ